MQDADVQKAIELHKQGLPPALLADRFQIPVGSLTRKLREAGYRIKPPQGLLADTLAEALSNGATLRQAARVAGVSMSRARRSWRVVCHRYGEHFEEEF